MKNQLFDFEESKDFFIFCFKKPYKILDRKTLLIEIFNENKLKYLSEL
jgi:hypothetical protein